MEQDEGTGEKCRKKGRRRVDSRLKALNKSVTLYPDEWQRLAELAEDGSCTKEAARIIRKALENRE